MNKAYKVPRPSRFFLSEVLPNCLAAGEPYIAYGIHTSSPEAAPPS